MTDHLLARARRSSITDMQLCVPLRWLTKNESLVVERIRPGQHTGHAIELQIWHPTTTKTPKEETIPAIQEPRTQHTFRLSDVVDADHNLHPLLDYLPSSAPTLEQTPSQWQSPRAQVHHEDAAAVMPSVLEQTGFQIHHQS